MDVPLLTKWKKKNSPWARFITLAFVDAPLFYVNDPLLSMWTFPKLLSFVWTAVKKAFNSIMLKIIEGEVQEFVGSFNGLRS